MQQYQIKEQALGQIHLRSIDLSQISAFEQQIPRYALQQGLFHFIKQYTSHRCHLPLEIFKWIFFYDKSLLLTKIKVLKRYHLKTAILRHLFFTQEVEKEFKRRLCSKHNFCIGYGSVYFVPERQTNDKRYYLYVLLPSTSRCCMTVKSQAAKGQYKTINNKP